MHVYIVRIARHWLHITTTKVGRSYFYVTSVFFANQTLIFRTADRRPSKVYKRSRVPILARKIDSYISAKPSLISTVKWKTRIDNLLPRTQKYKYHEVKRLVEDRTHTNPLNRRWHLKTECIVKNDGSVILYEVESISLREGWQHADLCSPRIQFN